MFHYGQDKLLPGVKILNVNREIIVQGDVFGAGVKCKGTTGHMTLQNVRSRLKLVAVLCLRKQRLFNVYLTQNVCLCAPEALCIVRDDFHWLFCHVWFEGKLECRYRRHGKQSHCRGGRRDCL